MSRKLSLRTTNQKFIFTIAFGLSCMIGHAAMLLKGVELKQLPSLPLESIHGYYSHSFLLINRTEQSHQLGLSLISDLDSAHYTHMGDVRKYCIVPPGNATKITLYWPAVNFYAPQLRGTIDGKRFKGEELGISLVSFHPNHYNNGKNILVAQSMPGNTQKYRQPSTPSHKYGKSSEPYKYLYSNIPVSQWDSDWLLYSGYDGIMITQEELNTASEEVVNALDQYVRLGGVMVVYTRSEEKRAEMGRIWKEPSGFGLKYFIGEEPEKLKSSEWKMLWEAFSQTAFSLLQNSNISVETANGLFKVAKDVEIPVRSLFVLMLIFAILIGPLNFYILFRRKKRIWLLWTSPVIASLFAGIVIVYMFFSEGLSTRTKLKSFTFLDENSRTASSLGVVAYYCPIVPSNGLLFSSETELCLVHSYYGTSQRLTMDLTRGQNLTSGWLRSRIPAHFHLRKGEVRRERIEVLKRGRSEIEALNGLGSEIKSLELMDFDEKRYVSDAPIAPGQKVTLRLKNEKAADNEHFHTALRQVFRLSWLNSDGLKLGGFVPGKNSPLTKGTYHAILRKSPFVSPGLKGGDLQEECVVVGKMLDGDGKI